MSRSLGALAAAATWILLHLGEGPQRAPRLELASEPRRADPRFLARTAQKPLEFARLASLWADHACQCLIPVGFRPAISLAGFGSQMRVQAHQPRRNLAAVLIPIALPRPANDVPGRADVALEAAQAAKVRILPRAHFKGFRHERQLRRAA